MKLPFIKELISVEFLFKEKFDNKVPTMSGNLAISTLSFVRHFLLKELQPYWHLEMYLV